jgi:hypothetical protein
MLRPLGWKSCLVLIKYAAETLHQPRLLARLFDYMKVTFKEWDVPALNILLRGSSQARDNALATAVEEKVFGGSLLAAPNSGRRKPVPNEPQDELHGIISPNVQRQSAHTKYRQEYPNESQVKALIDGIDTEALQANSHSVVALIKHLTVTMQFERLIVLIYTLLPYLAVNTETPKDQVEKLAELTGATISSTGRILPVRLPAELFGAIVAGLSKSGNTGLAQRVFKLAQSYEKKDHTTRKGKARSALKSRALADAASPGEQAAPVPAPPHPAADWFIQIHMYTSLIQVYANEARPRPNAIDQNPRGWTVSPSFKFMTRVEAGHHMAWETYTEAMRRWRTSKRLYDDAMEQQAQGLNVECIVTERDLADRAPDGRFFKAIIETYARHWNLFTDELLDQRSRSKVMRVLRDMSEAGVPIPPGLATKLATGKREGSVYPDVAVTKSLKRRKPVARNVVQEGRKQLGIAPKVFGMAGQYDKEALDEPAQPEFAERHRSHVDATSTEEVPPELEEVKDGEAGVEESEREDEKQANLSPSLGVQ